MGKQFFMAMHRLSGFLILAVVALVAVGAKAQMETPDPFAMPDSPPVMQTQVVTSQPASRDPQAPVKLPRFNGSFADFRRVDFVCRSDSSGDYISNAICTVAQNTAHSAALDSDLRFGSDLRNGGNDGFVLLVRVTSSGVAPRAVSVLVQASRYYESAVDKDAPFETAAAWPRHGKLVMYEEIITGVGQGDTLENGMRVGVRRVIQGLFARIRDEQKDAR